MRRARSAGRDHRAYHSHPSGPPGHRHGPRPALPTRRCSTSHFAGARDADGARVPAEDGTSVPSNSSLCRDDVGAGCPEPGGRTGQVTRLQIPPTHRPHSCRAAPRRRDRLQKDDVLWLLRRREGAPLPGEPQPSPRLCVTVTSATVTAGPGYRRHGRRRLTVTYCDEGGIDAVENPGVCAIGRHAVPSAPRIAPGDIYNRRVGGRAPRRRLFAESRGALSIRNSAPVPAAQRRSTAVSGAERRGTRNVLWSRCDGTRARSARPWQRPRGFVSPSDGFSPRRRALDHAVRSSQLQPYVS